MAVSAKSIGLTASPPGSTSAGGPAPAAPTAPAPAGYDEIRVPLPDGGVRHLTLADFEALPLPERVALLMKGKMQFFRQGRAITAREALRGR